MSFVYSTNTGEAIPGLAPDVDYYAIVDPTKPEQLRLAETRDDATAGVAVEFGQDFARLVGLGSRGSLPIVSATGGPTGLLDMNGRTWPDGTEFSDGEVVTFAPGTGQFLGFLNDGGAIAGPLTGQYVLRLAIADSTTEQRVWLETLTGERVGFSTAARFITDSGTVLTVAAFEENISEINFNVAEGFAGLPQNTTSDLAMLVTGMPLQYVAGYGIDTPGLVDDTIFYAVVDPLTPGRVRLALTAEQAHAADRGHPTLAYTVIDDQENETAKTLEIADVLGGRTIVTLNDPALSAGAAVGLQAGSTVADQRTVGW